MTSGWLSLIILFFVTASVFFAVLNGRKRGLTLALIKLLVSICSIFAAAFVATLLSSSLGAKIADEICGMITISETDIPGIDDALVLVLNMVSASLLFIPLFILIKILLGTVADLVYSKKLKKPQKAMNYISEDADYSNNKNALYGGIVGALTGFIFAVAVTSPFIGALKTTVRIVDIADSMGAEPSDDIIDDIEFFASDISANLLYTCGGEIIYNLSTRTKTLGKMTSLKHELDVIESLLCKNGFTSFLDDVSSLTPDAADAIIGYCEIAESSALAKIILNEFLVGASQAWLNGESYNSISRPALGDNEIVNEITDKILSICALSSPSTVTADITTLAKIAKLVSRYDVNNADLASLVSNDPNSLFNQLISTLNENEHMKQIVNDTDSIVLSAVAREMKNFDMTNFSYEDLIADFADSLSLVNNLKKQKRIDEMTDYIYEHLDEYGINVSTELSSIVAKELVEEFANHPGDITEEDVYQFFENYS